MDFVSNTDIQRLLVRFPPFMMAVIFHEYSHGLAAKFWGDKTAEEQGRLTLNPIPHIDILGTIILPMINMVSTIPILIGWAKPVPIDPRRFRKFRQGLFWVSLAGPAMNVLLAVLAAAVLCALVRWLPQDTTLGEPLMEMVKVAIPLNFALAIFNLLPLPPLDGSKIIESVLPARQAMKFEQLSRYGFFILMALMFSGALSFLARPIGYLTQLTLETMLRLFQINV